jgi:hypothetical protein
MLVAAVTEFAPSSTVTYLAKQAEVYSSLCSKPIATVLPESPLVPPPVHTLKQKNPVHTVPSHSLGPILILSSHLRYVYQAASLTQIFPT